MDQGHQMTEQELKRLERRISQIYRDARNSLDETVKSYFDSFAEKDQKMKKLVDTEINGKTWTEEDYRQWRLAQIGRGKRFEDLRDKMAERYTQANEVAVSYINDETPNIYSLNRNYSAYTIEQVAGDVGFTMWDESTVRRLIVEDPDVMPYYPPEKALKRGIDLAYGKRQITASVTSGILQGLSVGKIANDLQQRISTMNLASAVRSARTAVTGAQNAGRMDSYAAAQKMGIKLQKEWVATLDSRTRHTHAVVDGEKKNVKQKFSNGCRFPGDPQGRPEEVYNCRCTVIASLDDVNPENAKRWARNPKTKKPMKIKDMTFSQWAGWKEDEQ